jgi:hypothetical protein
MIMHLSDLEAAIFRGLLKASRIAVPTSHTLGPTQLADLPQPKSTELLELCKKLAAEAYRNGFLEPPDIPPEEVTDLLGGAVAQFVGRVRTKKDFAFKADDSFDLVEQAETLRHLRDSHMLPAEYRTLFPKVYAAWSESPPFAYLMEFLGDGRTKLNRYLFCGENPISPNRVLRPLIELVFGLFERTKHNLLIPSLDAIYIERIKGRLRRAKALDDNFRRIVESARIVINSKEYAQYGVYLGALTDKLAPLQPRFSTFVHGDLHPGNIFFRGEGEAFEVNFIDPKPWIWGDYLFDVGKLLHYVMVTGPLEDAHTVRPNIGDEQPPRIEYEISLPDRAHRIVDLTISKLEQFATQNDDVNFKPRLKLSVATNLLALCQNRLDRKEPLLDNAVLFYCEGLRYLRELAEDLAA